MQSEMYRSSPVWYVAVSGFRETTRGWRKYSFGSMPYTSASWIDSYMSQTPTASREASTSAPSPVVVRRNKAAAMPATSARPPCTSPKPFAGARTGLIPSGVAM